MYIPEFFCGVAATIILEIVILIVISLVYSSKKKS